MTPTPPSASDTPHAPLSLVATDLDGTLLREGNQISPLNQQALQRAHAAGVHLVVATGRPMRRLDYLGDLFDERPFHVISSNGACVDQLGADKPLWTHEVPHAELMRFCERVREAVPGVLIALEGRDDWACDPDFPLREDGRAPVLRGSVFEQLDAVRPLKVMVHHLQIGTLELFERCAPLADGLTCIYSYVHHEGMLEVAAPGVNKGAALTELAAWLGCDLARAAAFGDMPNDLEMLLAVGHGFGMPHSDAALVSSGIPLLDGQPDDAVGRAVLALLDEAR